jgi:anthranilate phosphoribosyltransferase
MNFTHFIKEIGRARDGSHDLDAEDAFQLYGAMLDGGVPELELGAIMLALRMKSESVSELLGFESALAARVYPLHAPDDAVRPVVIPTYNGARRQPNLLPLLALLLQRFGVPVLLHGTLEGHGRVASAYILRDLGVFPSASLAQAQQALDTDKLAFVPTAVLSPGLATLLSLRNRLGVRSSSHIMAKLIDPFGGEALRLVSVSHPGYLDKLRDFFAQTGANALLLRSTEGEAFANPLRRPQLELFREGNGTVLFEAEAGPIKSLPAQAAGHDAHTTAAWIKQALAGEVPLPLPLVNQLACCLYGAGYTQDMNQAKAIVAVETGSLAAA